MSNDKLDLIFNCCPKPKNLNFNNFKDVRSEELYSTICEIIKPKKILEIGSWEGASAIGWKLSSEKFNNDCKVYCIDTWLGSPEHYLSDQKNSNWSIDQLKIDKRGPQFFEKFLANIHNHGLQNYIIPFRADSSSALVFFKKINIKFDVIYIDGAHDYISVMNDIVLSYQLLNEGGLICGDDYIWESVRQGVMLAKLNKSTPMFKVFHKNNDFILIEKDRLNLINSFKNLYLVDSGFKVIFKLVRIFFKRLLVVFIKLFKI